MVASPGLMVMALEMVRMPGVCVCGQGRDGFSGKGDSTLSCVLPART